MRPTGSATSTSAAAAAAPAIDSSDINSLFKTLGARGWNDASIQQFTKAVIDSGQFESQKGKIWQAIMTPQMPIEAHRDERFMEVLAWYTDKSTAQRGDGRLTSDEVQTAMVKNGQQYASQLLAGPGGDTHQRLQSWKMVQKLRMLKSAIAERQASTGQAHYPYRARAMMQINHNDPWNAKHTIRNPQDFQRNVLDASYERPVMVKFGLTYCAHCMLLEQLGSVPAVSRKYADKMDVFKLWWNPHGAEFSELNAIASEQGVSSSPYFILYENGAIKHHGYAFPDEKGDGMEDFLRAGGII